MAKIKAIHYTDRAGVETLSFVDGWENMKEFVPTQDGQRHYYEATNRWNGDVIRIYNASVVIYEKE